MPWCQSSKPDVILGFFVNQPSPVLVYAATETCGHLDRRAGGKGFESETGSLGHRLRRNSPCLDLPLTKDA